jgi:NAD+ synthase (glutamine-hydrolysing)
MTLSICVAQLNFVVGDLTGNAQRIIQAARSAYAQGARLVLTPELSIAGYAAEDLFLRPSFLEACDLALAQVSQALADLPGLFVVVGHPARLVTTTAAAPHPTSPGHSPLNAAFARSLSVAQCTNSATVLSEGRVVATYAKRELPNYQVFDERRYFVPGQSATVFEVAGVKVGLLICEDAWFDAPAEEAKAAGAEMLAVLNASPFHVGKTHERQSRMAECARAVNLPLIYAHLVGGQDEVVFDGASFAVQAHGELAALAPSFQEIKMQLGFEKSSDSNQPGIWVNGSVAPERSPEADLWDALVLGVRDYVTKNGFPSVLLGLSGGIDSALVLAIAVDAFGADKVRAVMMPSPYTADISWLDARDMAARLNVRYDELSIVPEFDAFKASLASDFKGLAEDATEENIQARIRGTLLMALSNKFGALVLTTGNKSEMATGYCTLYGDMAGGFAVIKDVAKTTVFDLAWWRNAHDPYGTGQEPIPERIITRPPSAELRPDQKDQDSLPPYEVLDEILERYMENNESIESIIASGLPKADVERVTRLIKINEYKRRQAPVGIRVTHRSFGKDWRYPITSQFRS